MSRASVRAAVANWFAAPAILGLNKVSTSQPKLAYPSEAFFGPNDPSGAVGFVFIEREEEMRRALGGPHGGTKELIYEVGLVIEFRSTHPLAEDAMDDYDSIIDLIKVRLRSDRTLGGQVFSAGEGNVLNGRDIEVLSDLPQIMDDTTHIWSAVRFHVLDFITS